MFVHAYVSKKHQIGAGRYWGPYWYKTMCNREWRKNPDGPLDADGFPPRGSHFTTSPHLVTCKRCLAMILPKYKAILTKIEINFVSLAEEDPTISET